MAGKHLCSDLLRSVGLSLTFPNIYEEAHWFLPAQTIGCSPLQARYRRLAGEQHSGDMQSCTQAAVICFLIITQWLYTIIKHYVLGCPLVSPAYHKPVISYPVFYLQWTYCCLFNYFQFYSKSSSLCLVITMYHLFPHKLTCKGTFISLVLDHLLKQVSLLGYSLMLFRTFSDVPAIQSSW